MTPASQRAQAGAKLLDAHLPGWATRIDPDRMDTAGGVLGQLRGQRVSVSGLCAVLVVNQAAHGFTPNNPNNQDDPGHDPDDETDANDPDDGDATEDGEALAVAWRAEITRRTVTRIH